MLWNKIDLGMSLRYEAQRAHSWRFSHWECKNCESNDAFTAMDRDPPDAILMVSDSPEPAALGIVSCLAVILLELVQRRDRNVTRLAIVICVLRYCAPCHRQTNVHIAALRRGNGHGLF